MRAYLRELRDGFRILCRRDFWRAFADYWHPDAVAARLRAFTESLDEYTAFQAAPDEPDEPALHVFTWPKVDGWKPATVEDALALSSDMVLYGTAFATRDGRRVHPDTVRVVNGRAYGGTVQLP